MSCKGGELLSSSLRRRSKSDTALAKAMSHTYMDCSIIIVTAWAG
eukprot:COSAG01_NODE_3165_length_6476_cov_31.556845_4_plen_45_part_00